MTHVTRSIASLLSPVRMHDHDNEPRDGALFAPLRSPFETDGDKISFCEGLRSLADKTQVHDRTYAGGMFRNRLTHSLEVARVGRSLGVGVGARMLNLLALNAPAKGDAVWRVDPNDIGHIVAAACLAHDIGNPPFGHDGEDSISAFFQSHETGKKITGMVSSTISRELKQHEGNAQGFRMITRSMGWRPGVGLNLTAATLAAFGKYPYALRSGEKKYGVHAADLSTMERVAEQTDMLPDGKGGWIRHPLAWLMEAADDICYLTVDLEDAAQIGLISFDEVLDLFAPVVGADVVSQSRRLDDRAASLQFLRSHMIKALIASCVEIYAKIATRIESGTLGKNAHGSGLVSHGRHGEAIAAIRAYSKTRIYHAQSVQESRKAYREDMSVCLDGLGRDVMAWIETRRADEYLTQHDADMPFLSKIPKAILGVRVPQNPDEAFPWLLDQITLMSDADILRLAQTA